jgi:hypothetical protein
LAYFGARWIAIAQVADHDFFLGRMQMWDSPRAGLYALAASGALFLVNGYSGGFSVHGQSLERASFDAGVVLALGA